MATVEKEKKKKAPKIVSVDYGSVGTSLFSGIINVEFNSDLDGQNGIAVFDQMRKGDATVGAVLEAIKSPLGSAKHFIQEADKSLKAKKIADFVREALFERMDYDEFFEESQTNYDFGFSIFEKIFTIDSKGMVWWKRFAPRVQTSIYEWKMRSNPQWVNGRPSGITQQLPGNTDDVAGDKPTQPEIPWEKLVYFVNKKEGNNFAGVSVLRNAYKHWFYKDILYKIQGISAERFGVGIPYATHKGGLSKEATNNLEELLGNMRSNEQAYARVEDTITLDILMPKGDPKASSIKDAIDHHDRKIYDSILAGFLNLTTGDGGSNALSKDQSSFFMRSLRKRADNYKAKMAAHIKELVNYNFTDADGLYPTLEIENIGEISLDEQINAIGTAKDKGLITITTADEVMVREILGMPSMTADEVDAAKTQSKEEAAVETKIDTESDSVKKEVDTEEVVNKKEEENTEIKASESDKKEFSIDVDFSLEGATRGTYQEAFANEAIKRMGEIGGNKHNTTFYVDPTGLGDAVINELSYRGYKVKTKRFFKEPKKKVPTSREKTFTKNITDFEAFLEESHREFEGVLENAESRYKKALTVVYEAADKERVDGVMVLADTANNRTLSKKLQKVIDEITKKHLTDKLINSGMQERFFAKTHKAALATLKWNSGFFAEEMKINQGKFNSFIAGYISNVEGVLFNEPRKIKENVVLNFGSHVSFDLALEQAGQLKFNRNIFKLSTVTHARAAYSSIVYDASVKDGFTFFKVLVPKNKIKEISPEGQTAKVLFGIFTAAQLNQMMNKESEGKNANSVSGLGLHHGSFEYYYPIASVDLGEEEKIAAEQKKNFEETKK